jgi:hypothetical protein
MASVAVPGSGKTAKNRKREEQRQRAKERAANPAAFAPKTDRPSRRATFAVPDFEAAPSRPAGVRPPPGATDGGGRGGRGGRGGGRGDGGRGAGGRGARGGDGGRGRGGRGRGGRGRGSSELSGGGRDVKGAVEEAPSGFQHLVIIPIYWKQREGERAAVVDVCLAVKAFCGECDS